MRKTAVFAAITTLGIASAAVAGGTGSTSIDIDTEWLGSDTGIVVSQVFSLPDILSMTSIEMDLAHTWAGDLIILLEAPNGDVFNLADEQGSGSDLGLVGGSFELTNVDMYSFQEVGNSLPWGTSSDGHYPSSNSPYTANIWFTGGYAAGDWLLTVEDTALGDGGAVGTVTLNYAVPAPGALALLGVAGLIGARRRRNS